ncbi:MAG: tRNA lysidine(34) synthetase TilS [Acidobacteriota bacterium]
MAFSGGPDSSALLHALHELAPVLRLSLVAAHVDHRQRPGSEKDLVYCRRVAARLGLPVLTETLPGGRMSEAELRDHRYACLSRAAAMVGASGIAVGHTRDDRAETFLLNLVRGSGSRGLGSMRVEALHHDARIVRPMLEASRAEVLSFLEAGGWRHVVDASNADRRIDRNRIRHELLPLIETIRPGATAAIARAAEVLSQEADYLRRIARRAMSRRDGAPQPIPPRLHAAAARVLAREVIAEGGLVADVGLDTIDEVLRAARATRKDGVVRHLPLRGSRVVEVTRAGIRIVRGFRGRPGAAAPGQKKSTTREKSIS